MKKKIKEVIVVEGKDDISAVKNAVETNRVKSVFFMVYPYLISLIIVIRSAMFN